MFTLPKKAEAQTLITNNWKPALTVALISVPLSIALSIASGAGPLPGIIAGIWGTLIGSIFIGSNYNILGAAGALTTVLFGATLVAPLGLGTDVLPLLAIFSGLIILGIWLLRLDNYLYYIPSSVMYGFAAGVAILIAIAQLFDATGLSTLKRTGHVIGDIELFLANLDLVHKPTVLVFLAFLIGILVWKKKVKTIPAVIPAAVAGIIFGFLEANYFGLDIISLFDKFGAITATLMVPVAWAALPQLFSDMTALKTVLGAASLIALISVLETLITAKLGDKLTRSESSSSRELLGLSLSNLGSGVMGGLPTTGVFIRTGANIKAGATHRTSGILAAIFTGAIALVALPFFSYLPMAVIAAILVNTALGLLEVEKFKEYWNYERESFFVAVLVALVTIFHDAGLGVALGALLALLLFARRIAHGSFDVTWNYSDNSFESAHSKQAIVFPATDKKLTVVTYSIAGTLGYIDATRHLSNLKKLATNPAVPAVIIRLRDLFSIDYEGCEALAEAVHELTTNKKIVAISSASEQIMSELITFPAVAHIKKEGQYYSKTSEAILAIKQNLN